MTTCHFDDETAQEMFFPMTERDANALALHLTHRGDFPELEGALRRVTLHGDRSLRPYATATIASRSAPIADLRPIATYALTSQLDYQRRIRSALASEYGIDLFDLDGLITYERDGSVYTMTPPVIETAYDPALGEVVSAIVDGQHRVWLARALGYERIRVVEITHIAHDLPLLSLPLRWEDAREVETVPPTGEKRRFRFQSPEALRAAIAHLTKTPITGENFRYFLYRDLAVLGSSGIRSASDE